MQYLGKGNKYRRRDEIMQGENMPERDVELIELRERIMKLELKVEDLTKRVDNMQNYMKQLYTYLQQSSSKSSPIF